MVNISNMMKQSQELQKKMSEAQEKLNLIEVEGMSGGGVVNVIANAKVLSEVLVNRGFRIVTGGTDSHIVWLDLTPKNLTGDKAEKLLEDVGIACNKNAIPYDPKPPKITSGLRFGTPAATSRGFNTKDFDVVGNMIVGILDSLLLEDLKIKEISAQTKREVIDLCSRYPIYTEAF